MSQMHRLLQLKCVKDWAGWQDVKPISGNKYSNAFKAVMIGDCIKKFAFLCQDVVTVDQCPRDASRRK